MQKYRVQYERGDEFEERLNLYIYLLDLCKNVSHAQRVYDSWLEWCKTQKNL